MSTPKRPQSQWIRKASLLVTSAAAPASSDFYYEVAQPDGKGIDLSEMQFQFQVMQNDDQSPNHATIRVWNLSDTTVKRIQGEFDRVMLQAGYENGMFGIIFSGSIKQFRIGKANQTDKYLDILAADADIGYNFGVVNKTLSAGYKPRDAVQAAISAMSRVDTTVSDGYTTTLSGTESLRGKVLFGMARDVMRDISKTQNSSWSIQNGAVQIVPLDGYLPGEAVVLNSLTGMIGMPELTDEGVRVRVLLNPRIVVGTLVKIDNKSINKLVQQNARDPIPFNQYTGIQRNAAESADGLYRVYVCEHEGDTRGQEWYSDLICLAVNSISKQVDPY